MKPPLFWMRPPEKAGIWPVLLAPLSWLWRAVSARRWAKGKHLKLSVPVICVGNINMGGTGKTPAVIEVVLKLSAMGKTAHVVSRGYGGSLVGPARVDPMQHSAQDVGDEPLLLAAFAPCWVAKDRVVGAQAAIADGADVIVLDDGMQNPSLAKDMVIMVVDAQIGFGNGRVFPAGPLRQDISQGMERADLVLAIGATEFQEPYFARWGMASQTPYIRGQLEPLQTGMDWQGLHTLAFAGIGRPQKFFDTLTALGATIAAQHSFADHQKLSLTVMRRMEKEAHSLGAQMVTTEKDAARLPKEYRHKVLTLPVRLKVVDEKMLQEKLSALF